MLDRKSKYLQIAFNKSFTEVKEMVYKLPVSERIIIEAGTPFVRRYGQSGIRALNDWWSERIGKPAYIIADVKCMARAAQEVESAANAGASAITCLAPAPLEVINEFIIKCRERGIDSMLDMMNVSFPFEVLQRLETLPNIVVLHRGVDENVRNREKEIPYDQINKIKGTYNNVLISVAGGETTREVMRAYFNNADIVVVWRSFYESPDDTAKLAEDFLRLIK